MKIDIITLFPNMFKSPLTESIVMRAQKKGLVKIKIYQLRDWAINKHGQVDDKPYGGGSGMVLRMDVAFNVLKEVCKFKKIGSQKISNFQSPIGVEDKLPISNDGVASRPYIILPTPSGKKFDQAMARRLAKKKHLVFLCPHYEGYDHRIESIVSEKISIGDYILTGGELPVMVITDAVVRLIPGAINAESLKEESFSQNLKSQIPMTKQIPNPKSQNIENCKLKIENYLEYPQYTRPEIFEAEIRGKKIIKRVPKVLLSGNHKEIEKWREKMAK